MDLWLRFAAALGLDRELVQTAPPNDATRNLLHSGEELSAGAAGIAVAWAVESQSAPVSRKKLRGLADHYGIDGEAAEYFRLHATLDVDHTAELESMLERLDPDGLAEAQAISDTIQDGLWGPAQLG